MSGFLFYKALIVLKQLYQFCLPARIVNIKDIQYIEPLLLNLKVNRFKILVKCLSSPQVNIQWPSRILISVQKQYFMDKVVALAQSLQQILQNLSLVQPLKRVSLPLLVNCFFLYCISLRCSVFRYSLMLSSYRDKWLFIFIAFCIQQRSIKVVIQL